MIAGTAPDRWWNGYPTYLGIFKYGAGPDSPIPLDLANFLMLVGLAGAWTLLLSGRAAKGLFICSALLFVWLHFFKGYPVY